MQKGNQLTPVILTNASVFFAQQFFQGHKAMRVELINKGPPGTGGREICLVITY